MRDAVGDFFFGILPINLAQKNVLKLEFDRKKIELVKKAIFF